MWRVPVSHCDCQEETSLCQTHFKGEFQGATQRCGTYMGVQAWHLWWKWFCQSQLSHQSKRVSREWRRGWKRWSGMWAELDNGWMSPRVWFRGESASVSQSPHFTCLNRDLPTLGCQTSILARHHHISNIACHNISRCIWSYHIWISLCPPGHYLCRLPSIEAVMTCHQIILIHNPAVSSMPQMVTIFEGAVK